MSLDYERALYKKGYTFIAGCDEAGRGPLAGPVVAAAVIFDKNYRNDEIDDSKKLSDKKRRKLFQEIKENALAYEITIISPEKIDEINIYEASRLAMFESVKRLQVKPDYILTDAMPLKNIAIPQENIIKGDAKALSIAAASILAKVTRDDIMIELDKQYPQYGFAKHKGYPTKEHLLSLQKYGAIPGVYRYSYGPVKELRQKIPLF